jgi:hypothetical protein
MSFNRILKKVPIGSITSGGKEITLSVATQTSNWTSPEVVASQQGSDFRQAVEASKALVPQGTTEVCQRYPGKDMQVGKAIYTNLLVGKAIM